jgi:hypothetical protein
VAEVRIGEEAEAEYTEALAWYQARSARAAAAALAYRLHGKECSMKSWRTSSTWQQVSAVADKPLCKGAG